MGSSFEVPLTPDDRARLNEAADVLVLTRDRREDFVQTIGAIVYTTRLQSRLSSELSDVDGRAIAAANAVRSAYTALAKLSPRQRGQLGVILTHPFMVPRVSAMLAQKRNGGPLIFGPYHVIRQECDRLALQLGHDTCPWLDPTMDLDTEGNLVELMIKHLDTAFGKFIGRSPHAASGRRGKQKGTKAQWAMHDFVSQLWSTSRYYGEVTLSNKGGRADGSIVDILMALKPMLPKRFFPGILSHSFLRKVQKSLPPDPLKELRTLQGV